MLRTYLKRKSSDAEYGKDSCLTCLFFDSKDERCTNNTRESCTDDHTLWEPKTEAREAACFRDYAAAHVAAAISFNPRLRAENNIDQIADYAYRLADALIKKGKE